MFKNILLITMLSVGTMATSQVAEIDNRDSKELRFVSSEKNEILNTLDTVKQKKLRDVPWFVNRFKVSAGFYEALNSTELRVGNSSGSIGTSIDFEDDLGFQKYSPSFYSDIQWRSTSRSRFSLSYYNITRNALKKLRKTFEFGDNTYEVNTDVYANFNTKIYRFTYGYAILSKPKYELGLSIGTHIVDLSVTVGVRANNLSIEKKDNFKVKAPLPDFGIWGGYSLSNRFAITGDINYFAIKINQISGKVIATNFLVVFKVLENLHLSSGISTLRASVIAESKNATGYANWGNSGIVIKATYTFGRNKWQ